MVCKVKKRKSPDTALRPKQTNKIKNPPEIALKLNLFCVDMGLPLSVLISPLILLGGCQFFTCKQLPTQDSLRARARDLYLFSSQYQDPIWLRPVHTASLYDIICPAFLLCLKALFPWFLPAHRLCKTLSPLPTP